jgi:hypothetical protein
MAKPTYTAPEDQGDNAGSLIEVGAVGREFTMKDAELEAFMNEPVTILLSDSSDENAQPYAITSVNGTTRVAPRNVEVTLPRSHVEVLARCKETKYKPQPENMANPELSNRPIPTTVPVYPFQVIEDRNPKGRAWLAAVRAEPA